MADGSVFLPQAMLPFVRFEFPKKHLLGGDEDDICYFCGDWCSAHATCGQRYHMLQGWWLGPRPSIGASRQAPRSPIDVGEMIGSDAEEVDDQDDGTTAPVCDDCLRDEMHEGNAEIVVLGHLFHVDC